MSLIRRVSSLQQAWKHGFFMRVVVPIPPGCVSLRQFGRKSCSHNSEGKLQSGQALRFFILLSVAMIPRWSSSASVALSAAVSVVGSLPAAWQSFLYLSLCASQSTMSHSIPPSPPGFFKVSAHSCMLGAPCTAA